MKRDMDLLRQVLLQAEGMLAGTVMDLDLGDWDPGDVVEHARLLERAGFLDAGFTTGSPPGVHITGLTWAGYELLDSIRDDSVWSAVKEKLTTVGGGASLEVLKALAVQAVKLKLGLPDH